MGLGIGLIGSGRMGQEVARLAPQKGHRIISTFDRSRPLSAAALSQGIDVFIDFSHPGVVIDHIRTLAGGKAGLVIGTTGWYEQLDEIRNLGAGIGNVGRLCSQLLRRGQCLSQDCGGSREAVRRAG